jgi:hypothetical protein
MSTIIPRLYDTYGNAVEAVNDLKKGRYRDDEITLISNASNRESDVADDTATVIAKTGIPPDDAAAFAAVVDEGKSLVVVRAVFGAAARAITIVNRHSPLNLGVGSREYSTTKPSEKSPYIMDFGFAMLINDPAPFSNYWKLPLLLNDPAPFSKMFTWPTQWKGFVFGVPKLTSDSAPFSTWLGWPVLSKTTPASAAKQQSKT